MKKHLLFLTLAVGLFSSAAAAIPEGGWSVTPAPGATVVSITEIKVSKANEHYMDPYINRSVKINGESIAITQKASSDGSSIVMTLATPVEQSGEYEIVIPARTFTYDYDYWTDDSYDNPEMSWNVTVDNPDHPIVPDIPEVTVAATPASGETVKSLSEITVQFQGAAKAVPAEGATATVTSLGSAVECTVAIGAASEETPDAVTLTLTPALTVSGEYTVTVPEGAVEFATDADVKFSSPEFKLNYTVKAPPAVGERFVVDKIRYKVLSRDDMTVEVTFPESEPDYADLTTVPLSTVYEGETYTVTAIGDLAFSEVKGLEAFTVPEGIVRIGEGAFWESSLTEISIPASVTELGESAFENCQSLVAFDLPVNVTNVGASLLSGCASLKSVTLHEGLTAIPASFVQGCGLLESLEVPSTVTVIGEFAMSECSKLTQTNIPEGVTKLERFAYAYCVELTKLPVPQSVTELGHGVFYQSGLTEATLPEALTVIPDGTFQCCTNLKEFTIGNNVTEIELQAFYWCFGLEKIVFGEKVATIGSEAFKGDKAITDVMSLNTVPPTGAVFEQEVYDTATLKVPDEAIDAYRAADGWKEFQNIQTTSGLEAAAASGASLALAGDVLEIVSDTTVTVCTVQGVVLYQGTSGSVVLPSHGVYLVTSGDTTAKIVY